MLSFIPLCDTLKEKIEQNHQTKLNDTDSKTCNPDNNRNYCQSTQVFYLLLYQDLVKGKANRPVMGSHFYYSILMLNIQ